MRNWKCLKSIQVKVLIVNPMLSLDIDVELDIYHWTVGLLINSGLGTCRTSELWCDPWVFSDVADGPQDGYFGLRSQYLLAQGIWAWTETDHHTNKHTRMWKRGRGHIMSFKGMPLVTSLSSTRSPFSKALPPPCHATVDQHMASMRHLNHNKQCLHLEHSSWPSLRRPLYPSCVPITFRNGLFWLFLSGLRAL